ncbi:MAG: helix-turn-helix domain-containing protein, partial [Planctomycetes bacterium]|nr:helix-turn-helix domain-containing protein [Planctomycetota bacterium]
MEYANGKAVLTTGQVAKICHVAPRTVSKWFDTGQLRGYRIPGSRDRRIPVEHLEAFMRAHDIPLDALDGGRCKVLIVGGDPNESGAVAQVLKDSGRYDVRVAVNDFDAGMQAKGFHPHAIVMDIDADVREAIEACRKIKATASMQSAWII